VTDPPTTAPPDLLASPERARQQRDQAGDSPAWALTPRQQGELELLVSGALWPVIRYPTWADVDAIGRDMRLADGTPCPVPLTLDVTAEVAEAAEAAGQVALRDPEGVLLGVVTVTDHWVADRAAETEALYGTADLAHAGVDWWLRHHQPHRLAGPIEGIEPAAHFRFADLRLTPTDSRRALGAAAGRRSLGVATAQPLHRADVRHLLAEMAMEGLLGDGARLLVVGLIGPGPGPQFDPNVLVPAWQAVLAHLPDDPVLVVSPLPTYGHAERDTRLRDLVLTNHGATDRLDGPTPGDGDPDQELTPSALRARLDRGDALPPRFTYPEVEERLRRRYPPLSERGLTIFLTGLSGSGKSTVAQALASRLADRDRRSVALLDGDRVRHHLSSELGFSREHRNLNIHRIGFVAAEITRAGGIAICAPIAPYDEVRRDVRDMVSEVGSFVLIHVATPLAVCEARDRKGLYAKARAGIIAEFTGISDPYEVPTDAELTLDTTDLTVDEAVDHILVALEASGHLAPAP
jgi:sulfate adenylyltransferase